MTSSQATSAVLAVVFGVILTNIIFSLQQKKRKQKIVHSNAVKPKNKKPVRIYLDGCWDLAHSGHYNAIRQAKALGDILVVGIHSDEEITKAKREPIMNNEQRIACIRACKWVDEVAFDVPYSPSRQTLSNLNCDYVAHGDDIPLAPDGKSAYAEVEDKLKIFRRTPGVSTTQLIQRLLDAVKGTSEKPRYEQTSGWSSFVATSSRISAFSNHKVPKKDDKVVYIDGEFDLFHIGHINALKKAKELGTFLFVGLYDDETIQKRKGKHFPLMSLQERTLNVLSCKYVDDVIIGAPFRLTKEFLKSLNASVVVVTENTLVDAKESDRYDVAKGMGIFKKLDVDVKFNTNMLIKQIANQHDIIENQNKNRIQKDKQYCMDNVYVPESTHRV